MIFPHLSLVEPMLSLVGFHTMPIDKCQPQGLAIKIIEPVAREFGEFVQADAQDTGNKLSIISFKTKCCSIFCLFKYLSYYTLLYDVVDFTNFSPLIDISLIDSDVHL